MRILHIADLHLGRQFNGISLENDHGVILDQIVQAIITHEVDVLVIAGDIFDRASPSATAVRQLNMFLSRVASETTAAVAMIAGNHDSGDRIASMSIMNDTRRALIRGSIASNEISLILEDQHGPVAFSGLPFSYEYAARECFSDETIQTPEDVLRAQLSSARRNVPDGARWVIIAHAFVSGAQSSESERPLARVGGIETVRAEIFHGAHYVALGHLHRPQSASAPHICYAGSPLAFSFDDADNQKSMNLVEMDGVGGIKIKSIPFKPLRKVRVLRGRHAELLLAESSADLIKVILTDEIPLIDAMKRLREVFPNACQLIYERDASAPEIKSVAARIAKIADPIEVIGDFLEQIRGAGIAENELPIVTKALQDLRREEDAV